MNKQNHSKLLKLAASYGFNALTVGLGEAAVLLLIGYTLLCQLPKINSFREFFDKVNHS